MKKVVLKSDEAHIEGSFVVTVPAEKTRRRIASELVFDYKAGEKSSAAQNLKAASRLDEIVGSYVSDITIKIKDCGPFKTYADMQEDSDLEELCNQAQKIVLEGSLGKN